MNVLRNIVRDLVQRRLWPVALLLVAALGAVPVVLGGGPQPTAEPALPATGIPAGGTTTAQVSLDTGVPVRRDRGDRVRNPFKRPATPRPEQVARARASQVSPASPASSSAPSLPALDLPRGLGGGSALPVPGATGPRPAGGSTPRPKRQSTYHVTLRFGQTGKQETIRDIARLSPLPSVTDPFFVFLGVLEDGKTAVFLVSSDAVPTGDGICRPNDLTCDTIELRPGDTEWFDFTAPDGSVTQYQMDLMAVRRSKPQPLAGAARVRARHSAAGAELLRDAAVRGVDAAAGSDAYRFDPARGVLVRALRRPGVARAAAAAAVPLLPRSRQPGIPVWHWDRERAER